MKVNNDSIMMNTHRPTTVSGNMVSKLSLQRKINKLENDKVDLSISGRSQGVNNTAPIRKVKTAGLIITDLEISRPAKEGLPISFEKPIATVSNEKAALGTSENRLGGNTRNIDSSHNKNLQSMKSRILDMDKAKDLIFRTRRDMKDEFSTAILAQGNSNHDTVYELLR